MSHLPVLVEVVIYIHDSQKGGFTREEVIDSTRLSPEEVDETLNLMIEKGLLKVFGNRFFRTPAFDEMAPKLISIYSDLRGERSIELALRGALSLYSPLREDMLKRAMLDLGFSAEEFDDLLIADIQKGYIRRVRAVHVGKIRSGSRLLPVGFYADLDLDVRPFLEGFLEYYRRIGFIEEIFEEVLLIGRYPPEIARPAREYIKNERVEVRNQLRLSSPPIFTSPPFLSLTSL